jgi:bifunctional lysine-specific demethylase and histidyl-hydroxylase NO66
MVCQFCGRAQARFTWAGEVQGLGEIADAETVKRRYNEGATIRLLHPQRFCDPVWKLLALLEDVFQCLMGCNVYVTPPSSQVCVTRLMRYPL